jgi:hypothetical protein
VEKPTHGHGTLVAIPLLAVGTKPQTPNVWSAAIEKNMPDAKAVRVLVSKQFRLRIHAHIAIILHLGAQKSVKPTHARAVNFV